MRKVILAVAVLLLLSSIPLAVSQPHPSDLDGFDGEGVTPLAGNPLRVLCVYDEEFEAYQFSFFGETLAPQTYIKYQLLRAFYRFPLIFHFQIVGYEHWISDDSFNLEQSLMELEEAMGWQKGGMWYKGKWGSLLVGWTTQYDPERVGCAHVGYGACIISYQNDFTDENTVAEEVAHLFGGILQHHCKSDSCMISNKTLFYAWFDEPLTPIRDEVRTIWIWSNQIVGTISNEWCDEHWQGLLDSGAVVYWSHGEEGYFSSDPRLNLIGEEAKSKLRRLPTHPETPYLIALGIIVIAVVSYYLYRKKIRS